MPTTARVNAFSGASNSVVPLCFHAFYSSAGPRLAHGAVPNSRFMATPSHNAQLKRAHIPSRPLTSRSGSIRHGLVPEQVGSRSCFGTELGSVRAMSQRRCYSARPPEKPAQSEIDSSSPPRKKVTLQTIARLHRTREPITMITAHDYPSALFAERAGMDTVLVGDSLAMVALGLDSTTQLTLDDMLHHCRAVHRGLRTPFLIGDLPFGSYEVSPEQAVASAIRMVREGHVEAVKLEGGEEMEKTVRAITR
ncbi:hypothetical protein HDU93_001015, partial [Gonapodya sp. JEL0774]